jgi:hypothetical protein
MIRVILLLCLSYAYAWAAGNTGPARTIPREPLPGEQEHVVAEVPREGEFPRIAFDRALRRRRPEPIFIPPNLPPDGPRQNVESALYFVFAVVVYGVILVSLWYVVKIIGDSS